MLWLLPSSRGWLAFLLVLVISARTMAFLPGTVSLVPLNKCWSVLPTINLVLVGKGQTLLSRAIWFSVKVL